MRIEIKDVDPRDAAAFVQDIIDDLEITEPQTNALMEILRRHEMATEIWKDEYGCDTASPARPTKRYKNT